jgi:hypothetical protein
MLARAMPHFYAAQPLRGLANEINIYRFSSKVGRDRYIARHKDDGAPARPITKQEAQKLLQQRSVNILIATDC